MKVFSVIVCIFVLLLLSAYPAVGAPFLVCDAQTGITHYEVAVDGKTYVVDAQADTRLAYDLTGLQVGVHNFLVRAMILHNDPAGGAGSWGKSDAVPFVGTRILVNPVSGLSVRDAPF